MKIEGSVEDGAQTATSEDNCQFGKPVPDPRTQSETPIGTVHPKKHPKARNSGLNQERQAQWIFAIEIS
jgi:hypothetical protein